MRIKPSKTLILIILLILFGVFYRVILTSRDNFIFNIDNARDLVDVREMVELRKLRFIGPTSGIEGLYDGPAWYYLLAIPYVLSSGNPYAAILMLIFLWALGGFFILKIVNRWGIFAVLLVASFWIASNFIVLANLYTFNPNPIIFLMPIFIFFGERYLKRGRILDGIGYFGLPGLFFNFEMVSVFFLPILILASLIL